MLVQASYNTFFYRTTYFIFVFLKCNYHVPWYMIFTLSQSVKELIVSCYHIFNKNVIS